MNVDNALALANVLSAFWYVSGLTAVQTCLVRAWQSADVETKAGSLEEASHYQAVLLVPGAIAIGGSGVFLWERLDYDFLGSGWLLALEALYIVTLLICVPLIGMGIRRARIAALKARKHGRVTPELETAMGDSVPLVFGGIATLLVPVMAFLSIFRPF